MLLLLLLQADAFDSFMIFNACSGVRSLFVTQNITFFFVWIFLLTILRGKKGKASDVYVLNA